MGNFLQMSVGLDETPEQTYTIDIALLTIYSTP